MNMEASNSQKYHLPGTPRALKTPSSACCSPAISGGKARVAFKVFFERNKSVLKAKYPFLTASQIKSKASQQWHQLLKQGRQSHIKRYLFVNLLLPWGRCAHFSCFLKVIVLLCLPTTAGTHIGLVCFFLLFLFLFF